MKKLIKVVVVVLIAVVALILALPLWIGPVVKPVANSVVTKKLGTAFRLGDFALNPYVGRLSVGDVQLANPEGFSPVMAVEVNRLDVDVDVSSAFSDVVVIEDITLDGAFVSYVTKANMTSNFDVIKRNAMGTQKKDAGTQKDAVKPEEAAKPSAGSNPGGSEKADAKDESKSKSGKKVIIDHLLIKGVKVQFGPIPMPMPPVELNGIGRKSMGVSVQEAGIQIYEAILKQLNALGLNVTGLMKDFGDLGIKGFDDATKMLKDAGVKAKDVEKVMGVLDAIQKAGAERSGKVVEGSSKVMKATGDGVEKTIDGTTDAVKDASKAILGIFGK